MSFQVAFVIMLLKNLKLTSSNGAGIAEGVTPKAKNMNEDFAQSSFKPSESFRKFLFIDGFSMSDTPTSGICYRNYKLPSRCAPM